MKTGFVAANEQSYYSYGSLPIGTILRETVGQNTLYYTIVDMTYVDNLWRYHIDLLYQDGTTMRPMASIPIHYVNETHGWDIVGKPEAI